MAKKAKKRPVKAKAKRKPEVILPMKLSALIKIALRDIRKAEALPKQFVIEMSDWYVPEIVECRTNNDVLIETHKVCSVCAAGSVMAFSLGALKNHPDTLLEPHHYPKNQRQLNAINCLREGEAYQAYAELYPQVVDQKDYDKVVDQKDYDKLDDLSINIPDYDREDPEPFHKAMAQFETDLRKAGY